eukprot:CAMPEP_0117505114 /NCGR_PEP_ID=MMETSP0784-20121206/25207_1 /TAXON_ID=39447 /ORGANISM="" /LENGTH=231 /DNA_ID=CAMNT_0005300509 /DNA_START=58 /DNA_END=755 /DNA_ORIENTATION=-
MGAKASTQAPPSAAAPAGAAPTTPAAAPSKSGVKLTGAPPQAQPPAQPTPAAAVAPAAAPGAAAPASDGGGLMKQMAGSMATGMAAGVGANVADRAMDAMLGPRQVEVVHSGEAPAPAAAPPPPPPPAPKRCHHEREQLGQCVQQNAPSKIVSLSWTPSSGARRDWAEEGETRLSSVPLLWNRRSLHDGPWVIVASSAAGAEAMPPGEGAAGAMREAERAHRGLSDSPGRR